jgi:D-aminoacyl-tRNA deacylase
MRALLQRVTRASVAADGVEVGRVGSGLVVLLGVGPRDDESVAASLAAKVAGLRMFADSAGLTNLSVGDSGGAILVVSQFTLYADARRGRRPSFTGAGAPELGLRLYESFCEALRALGLHVECGRFGADMQVELVNDGPFTIWLDTEELGISPAT